MLWSSLAIQQQISPQPDWKTRTRRAIAWFIRFSLFHGEYVATGGRLHLPRSHKQDLLP